MTPKQSLFRRCLAILSAALLAAALVMVGTWLPAGATGTHGERGDRDDVKRLQIVLITDTGSGLQYPVQDRPFNVVVQVVDDDGKPVKVKKATRIELVEVSGPGQLEGNTTAVIQQGFSSTTIVGATYSEFANGVKFKVKVVYGDDLAPSKTITVEVALTAVGADAKPGTALTLKDPKCAAPTADVPNCGIFVLKNGADGHVTLSVGSCDGLIKVDDLRQCREVGDTEALVVTFIASLKNADGDPLYSKKHPAKVILACDKVLCPKGHKHHGVKKIKVIYTLNNTGPLTKVAPPCPKKGVIGKDQEACVDYKRAFRKNGDLFLPFLFNVDGRAQG